jgi:hypothetical protein
MLELVSSGVIDRDTYVWKQGLPDWQFAMNRPEFSNTLQQAPTELAPPPPPGTRPSMPAAPSYSAPYAEPEPPATPSYNAQPSATPVAVAPSYYEFGSLKSDRSRILAGILQLIIPGVGRMYMGFAAIGVLQLLLAMCAVGYVWSFIDGILILVGNVRHDGYGRKLVD